MTSPALNYDSTLAEKVHITPQEFRAGYDPALLVDKPATPSRNDSQPTTNNTHNVESSTAHLQRDAEKAQPLPPTKVPFFKTTKGIIVIVVVVIVVLAAAIGGGVGGSKKKKSPIVTQAATGGGPGGNPVGNATTIATTPPPPSSGTFGAPQTTADQGVGTAAPSQPTTTGAPVPGGGTGGGNGNGGGAIGQPPITLPVQPPNDNPDQAGQVPGSGSSS